MIQHQCPRMHLYHAPEGDDRGCPVCASQQAELTRTRGVWDASPPPNAAELTMDASRMTTGARGSETVGVYAHLGAAVEPVVGWLACVEGPDKGRDWRLVSGRNAIGRGDGMPVRLASDVGVSRERHALVIFDPRQGSFMLAPGDGKGLVYRNGAAVLVPVALQPFDRIELGASTLLFVPLVGAHFAWGG